MVPLISKVLTETSLEIISLTELNGERIMPVVFWASNYKMRVGANVRRPLLKTCSVEFFHFNFSAGMDVVEYNT